MQHVELLRALRETGCLFVVSAVESLDDTILKKLEKNHTRADFFRVVELCRRAGVTLQPTFVPFTPWTTIDQIVDLFEQVLRLELTEAVAPIQLAIRLLITQDSRLLELEDVRKIIGPFDAPALVYPWKNPNPVVDQLCEELQEIVAVSEKVKRGRSATFEKMWHAVNQAARRDLAAQAQKPFAARATVPYLNEPWYC